MKMAIKALIVLVVIVMALLATALIAGRVPPL